MTSPRYKRGCVADQPQQVRSSSGVVHSWAFVRKRLLRLTFQAQSRSGGSARMRPVAELHHSPAAREIIACGMAQQHPHPSLDERTYPKARQGVADSRRRVPLPQTESSTFELAFADPDFLLRDEMRGVRLELEWSKPDILQRENNIHSTIVMFGGARVLAPEVAEKRLADCESAAAASPDDAELAAQLTQARRLHAQSRYYTVARELARMVSGSCQTEGKCDFVVVTGGGPGIMEAANRGAHDVGAKSIGLNIVLPHEQAPNPYITPELSFQFHYFAIRKMHFLARAKALVAFPGGFGTLDELFEALTLIQTGKVTPIPVLLVGEEHWRRVINFEALVEEGVISPGDINLFEFVETAEEAWEKIREFYEMD